MKMLKLAFQMRISYFINYQCVLFLRQGNKLVVGERTKPVLRVQVFSSKEPAYLPTMVVKVDLPLTLHLPTSHDCKFYDVDQRTSVECRLSNPIKMGGSVRHANLNVYYSLYRPYANLNAYYFLYRPYFHTQFILHNEYMFPMQFWGLPDICMELSC